MTKEASSKLYMIVRIGVVVLRFDHICNLCLISLYLFNIILVRGQANWIMMSKNLRTSIIFQPSSEIMLVSDMLKLICTILVLDIDKYFQICCRYLLLHVIQSYNLCFKLMHWFKSGLLLL